ncbi:DNA-binding MarR family transcriptional regulator [Lactobacillus colini]|uniref:DNA-binding MarR family transcriptional regulator n=1 Tax=Lactobacillus colini TaxID=1819254 RepID=A0ABS4MBU9_9LACO|nr:MarR family transcriptional regulator [Lactobacillus colini]MBP2057157.1 DNA-binding MarR family transcriptional regulator [Lactobacillus colini]
MVSNERKEVFDNFLMLGGLFHKYHLQLIKEKGPGSSMQGQGRILALLKIKSELPTSDIAYILGIRQQSLNEQIKRLEAQELVERHPSEKDKRVMLVSLTEKGKNVRDDKGAFDDILTEFSDQELEQFNGYLSKLIDALVQKVHDEGCPSEDARLARMRESLSEDEFKQLMMMRRRFYGPEPMGLGRRPMGNRPHRRPFKKEK